MTSKKLGYTLTEIFIALCIIAVVLAVSIKAHRATVESATTLEYYSAYSTLKSAASTALINNNARNNVQRLPDQGQDFCRDFVNSVNTATGSAECGNTSSSISATETQFSGKTPDIILRNGMRIYNVKQNPEKIDALNGNSNGNTYMDAASHEIDVDEYGYTLYVDIDGAEVGDNTLWQDVFPFYVTLSGKTIPAYTTVKQNDKDIPIGGNSRNYLQVSVANEIDKNIQWVAKSVSFQEGACKMNYVKGDYCNGIANVCEENNSDCRLKIIVPIKFL